MQVLSRQRLASSARGVVESLESRTYLSDNTIATANDLGTLTGAISRSDVVNGGDTIDFYRVVHTGGFFKSFITNSTANLKLELSQDVDHSGTINRNPGSPEVIQNPIALNPAVAVSNLAAGTYFLGVFRQSTDSNYTLTISRQNDVGGSDFTTARDVGVPLNTVFSDSVVNTSDSADFFKLPLTATTQVSMQLSGLSQNAGLAIFRDTINPNAIDPGELLSSQTSSTPAAGVTRSVALSPGTYFVKIFATSTIATGYNLSIATSGAVKPDDTGGDSSTDPHALGPLDTAPHAFSEFVSKGLDDADFYAFSLTKLSVLHADLRGLTDDADLQIIKLVQGGQGLVEQVVLSSPIGGTSDEVIDGALLAGDYFAKVVARNGSTNYLLDLQVTQTDGAGETPGAARDIGTLGATAKTFNDRIGGIDTDDFYKIVLNDFRTITAKLTGLNSAIQADADLQLFAADGTTVLQTASTAGSANETLTKTLLPGTYFVRVKPVLGETNYTIKFSSVQGPDTPGETLATARNLGDFGETTKVTVSNEWVGGSDSSDIYKINLTHGALLFRGFVANADINLIRDKNGNGVIDSGEETAFTNPSANFVPGTLFLRVKPKANVPGFTYSFTIQTLPVDSAGNSRATARDIGSSPFNGVKFVGYVGSDDTSDLYKFSALGVFPVLDFKITLTGLGANADLLLLDEGGNTLASSSHSGTTNESIDFRPLIGGTFFVKVVRVSGNTLYNMTLTA
ncbi:MAG TPA: PPC domain-containing protein [Humisphaera sp.]|nr:PPC domain-containing protein [Humisphaera sp.]